MKKLTYAKHKLFLLVVALVEASTGLCLLLLPSPPLALLLGLESANVDTLLVGRITGAALFAIGVASWVARTNEPHSQVGLLMGISIYNAAVSGLLCYAGTMLKMAGGLLWPTIAFHAALAVWGGQLLLSIRDELPVAVQDS